LVNYNRKVFSFLKILKLLVVYLITVLIFCCLHVVCASLGTSKGVPCSELEALSRKMKWSKPRYDLFKRTEWITNQSILISASDFFIKCRSFDFSEGLILWLIMALVWCCLQICPQCWVANFGEKTSGYSYRRGKNTRRRGQGLPNILGAKGTWERGIV